MQLPQIYAVMDKTIENTARVLANLGSKDHGPSKGFQALIRQIGEAKNKARKLMPAE